MTDYPATGGGSLKLRIRLCSPKNAVGRRDDEFFVQVDADDIYNKRPIVFRPTSRGGAKGHMQFLELLIDKLTTDSNYSLFDGFTVTLVMRRLSQEPEDAKPERLEERPLLD